MTLPDHVVADELIESAWGNAVVDTLTTHDSAINLGTVRRFSSTAVRDANYPANIAGVGAVCAAGSQLFVSDGTTWILQAPQSAVDAANANITNVGNSAQAQINTLTANTRSMGCQATGPAGSTSGPVIANLQFTGATIDTDGLYAASHPAYVQVPVTGIWAATITVTLNGGYNLVGGVDLLLNSAIVVSMAGNFNTGAPSASMVRYLGAGSTIGARFFIPSGLVTWTNTTLDVWRVS